MNKTVIASIAGVLLIGAIAIYVINQNDTVDTEVLEAGPATVTRPAVQPVGNTFSIMTPEEKAAADNAARIQAEEAERASTTGTSSEESDEVETTEESEQE